MPSPWTPTRQAEPKRLSGPDSAEERPGVWGVVGRDLTPQFQAQMLIQVRGPGEKNNQKALPKAPLAIGCAGCAVTDQHQLGSLNNLNNLNNLKGKKAKRKNRNLWILVFRLCRLCSNSRPAGKMPESTAQPMSWRGFRGMGLEKPAKTANFNKPRAKQYPKTPIKQHQNTAALDGSVYIRECFAYNRA